MPDPLHSYEEMLRARGVNVETFVLDSGGTIVGAARGVVPPMAQADALPVADAGHTLGEGGMGIVRATTQTGLDRPVAVKTLKDDSTHARRALLREAWVTGQLQHPNVIPVHALGTDAEGRLAIMMKQVEGQAWAALLDAEEGHPALQGEAPMTFHLDVLDQVCRAVHFAHTQGILHRDLKPENVMIGVHGEVYVLDWGLAVTLPGAPEGPLPPALEVATVEGTPGYLAPEMASADGERISVRSDVFLLGAILHRLLTGQERWGGASVLQTLVNAHLAVPFHYAEDLPDELVGIVARATAPHPVERYADVEAFRRDVADYRTHEAAVALADRALERLEVLQAALARTEAEEELVAGVAAEVRFGLQSALEIWPENERARLALDALAERMLDFELSRDNPAGAANWLRLLRQPPPHFEHAIDDARARLEAQRLEAQRLSREVDPAVGGRTRVRSSMWVTALVAVWAAVAQGVAWATGELPGYGTLIALWTVYTLALASMGMRARARLTRAASTQLVVSLVNGAMLAIVPALAWAMELGPVWKIAVICYELTALLTVILAVTATRRMWLPASVFALGGLGTWLFPHLFWGILAALGAGGMVGMGWAWSWALARRPAN